MSEPNPAAPKLQTFYVYAPDKKEAGVLDKRFSVRPQHLERMSGLISSKVIRFGGVLLDPEDQPTEADPRPRLSGSMMVVEAESIEKVKEIITTDIYYESGVWDPEKLVICPIIPAVPLP
ncbi:hypothetical protein FA13DRAFT_1786612 [Coprinellus micaceus]|uniref:YCII-related domain-containing protein n=1 Tax=Coprinellus micaceus TaxID=71717 RepID=A0A4Y7TTJ3_COPMI|nr:hypothetical protein FA13DRAFT_1786612 [Coprinellus micaceus]